MAGEVTGRLAAALLAGAVVLSGCAAGGEASGAPSSGTVEVTPAPGGTPMQPDERLSDPRGLLRPTEPTDRRGAESSRPAPGAPPQGVPDAVTPLSPGVGAGLASTAEAAANDLADRLGIDVQRVEVLAAQAVTWSNAGLGCPEPGMSYAQVLTEGAVVELSAQGVRYRYHSGEGAAAPFPCDMPQPPV